MKRSGRPTRIGELLGESLPAEPAGRGALLAIVRAWPEVVGEVISHHAWPARMASGALVVHAESSVWVTELQLLAEPMAVRLRAATGGDVPAALRFVVGPVPDRGEPAPDRASPPVSDATRRRAASLAAPIRDEELRAAAQAAIGAVLARSEST